MNKVYFTIVLFFSVFFLPWWLFLILLVSGLFIFDWYWPLVLAAFVFDATYGLPSVGLWRTQFVWTVGTLLGLLMVGLFKRRLIYYRY